MPTKVTLDFEARSELPLKKVGAWVYSKHESSDVLCVCFKVDDGPVKASRGFNFGYSESVMDDLAFLAEDPDVIFEAHNAQFEYCIWHNIMHEVYDMPDIPIERWRCSAAVAAYKSMPRALGLLCKENALNAPHKKDEEGKRVMQRMAKPVPERYRHLHGYWYESEDDWQTLVSYCKDDVRTEHACSEILGELPPKEFDIWQLDFNINMRGIKVDLDLARSAREMKKGIIEGIHEECKNLCGLKASQVAKLKEWIKEQGVELPTKIDKKTQKIKERLDAPVLKRFMADPSLPQSVRRVVKLRRDYSTTSLAKYDAAIAMADENSVVRGQFLYHGATTGRWSGKGIQFQNLPRGNFDEDYALADMVESIGYIKESDLPSIRNWFHPKQTEMEVLKSCIRGLVIPRDGCLLRVEDFSQIEARVVAWLAGQQDVLDAFIAGRDLYKFTAAQIYEKEYEEVDKDERFIGKTASLALGYQGGKGAFVSMALNFGVLVEETLADKVKNDWRRRNKNIVKLWYNLENAAVRAIQFGKTVQVNGKITFRVEGDYLTMRLPSGRKLWYFKPELKRKTINPQNGGQFTRPEIRFMGSDSQRNIQWGRVGTYGGRLTENAVQAISRDLLAESMLDLEREGYPIIVHVHDEVVCETPAENTDDLSLIKGIMTRKREWAEGLPVAADGFETVRYYKG